MSCVNTYTIGAEPPELNSTQYRKCGEFAFSTYIIGCMGRQAPEPCGGDKLLDRNFANSEYLSIY
jgi:hypothetical protein